MKLFVCIQPMLYHGILHVPVCLICSHHLIYILFSNKLLLCDENIQPWKSVPVMKKINMKKRCTKLLISVLFNGIETALVWMRYFHSVCKSMIVVEHIFGHRKSLISIHGLLLLIQNYNIIEFLSVMLHNMNV